MSTETGGTNEDTGASKDAQPIQPSEEGSETPVTSAPAQPAPAEGKRTQLKVIRQNIEYLSRDLGNFRRSHEGSIKKLQTDIASIRKDLGTHMRSKELGEHIKSHQAGTKKLEKQVETLRKDLASLKSQMAKDAARSRAREEETLSKILKKVSAKPAKSAKSSKKA